MIPNSPNWLTRSGAVSNYPTSDAFNPGPVEEVHKVGLGPQVLNQSGGNIAGRYWLVTFEEGFIYLWESSPSGWINPTMQLAAEDVIQIEFTFDQLGRIMLYYLNGSGQSTLYWFDPQLNQPTELEISLATDILAGFDYVRDTGNPDSDAWLVYIRDSGLYWRLQRDRWDIEYGPEVTIEDLEIESLGVSLANRFQVVYSYISGTIPEEIVPFQVVENGYQVADEPNRSSILLKSPPQQNDGDLMIGVVMYRGTDLPTTPSGWTLVGHYHNLALGETFEQHIGVYQKVGGSAGTNEEVLFTGTLPGQMAAQVYSIQSASTIDNVLSIEHNAGGGGGSIDLSTASEKSIFICHWFHGTGTSDITGEDGLLGNTNSNPPFLKLIGAFSRTPTNYTVFTAEDADTSFGPGFGLLILEMT